MKRNSLLVLLIVIILALGAYIICRGTSKQLPGTSEPEQVTNTPQNSPDIVIPKNNPTSSQESNSIDTPQQNNSIPSDWKTYTNDQIGFTFQYPSMWTKKESNAINLEGAVMSRKINFIDTASETTLLIEYHVAPYGKILFEKKLSDFNSSQGIYANAKKIGVAGREAIEVSVTKAKDIHGNIYNPPLKEIFVDFLDKEEMGSIHLYFKTPLPNYDTEVSKLRLLLSTFKF